MKLTCQKIMMLTGFWLAATALGAPDIDLVPASVDFGAVELGSSGSVMIEMKNVGDSVLRLDEISLAGDDTAEFQITSFLYLPVFYGAGGSYYVEVTYTPSAEGIAEAALRIVSSDPDESNLEMSLRGQTPVQEEEEEEEETESAASPSEQIAAIIAFFDQAVEAGELDGAEAFRYRAKYLCQSKYKHGGKSKYIQIKRHWNEDAQLRAFRYQLAAVQKCIDRGWYRWMGGQLQSLYLKTDGLPRPPDFVEGPAAAELAAQIKQLMESLRQT